MFPGPGCCFKLFQTETCWNKEFEPSFWCNPLRLPLFWRAHDSRNHSAPTVMLVAISQVNSPRCSCCQFLQCSSPTQTSNASHVLLCPSEIRHLETLCRLRLAGGYDLQLVLEKQTAWGSFFHHFWTWSFGCSNQQFWFTHSKCGIPLATPKGSKQDFGNSWLSGKWLILRWMWERMSGVRTFYIFLWKAPPSWWLKPKWFHNSDLMNVV